MKLTPKVAAMDSQIISPLLVPVVLLMLLAMLVR